MTSHLFKLQNTKVETFSFMLINYVMKNISICYNQIDFSKLEIRQFLDAK